MFYLYISYPSDVTTHGGHGDAYTLHIVIAPHVFQLSCTNYQVYSYIGIYLIYLLR